MLTIQDKNWVYLSLTIVIVNILLLFYFLFDLIYIARFSWPYKDGASIDYVFIVETFFWERYADHCHFFLPKFSLLPIYFSGMTIGYGFGTYIRVMEKIQLEDSKNLEKENIYLRNKSSFITQKKLHRFLFTLIFLLMSISICLILKIGGSDFFQIIILFLPLITFNYSWNLALKEDGYKLLKILFIIVISGLLILILTFLSLFLGCL